MEALFDENAVVDAVASFLAASGYAIVQRRYGHERGIDLIARRDPPRSRLLYVVEARGGTSSRSGSAKFGKRMSGGKCESISLRRWIRPP